MSHTEHELEENHLGWIAPGQLEPTVDFDLDEVCRQLGEIDELPEQAQIKAAAVLSKLLVWTWSGNGTLVSAICRLSALMAGLRPDLLDRTYLELGEELGITRAAVSKAALKAQDMLGIKFSRSRPAEARLHMAAVRNRNPVGRNIEKKAA